MRLRRVVPMLATAITLSTGAAAPAALALDNTAPSSGQPTTLVLHHPDSSVDWLIILGTAGGVTLLGSGLAANRRGARRATPRGTTIPTTGRS